MRTPLAALLLALALLGPLALAAPGSGTPPTLTPGGSHDEDDRDEDDDKPDERADKERRSERARDDDRRRAAIGAFQLSATQSVDGDFVDFSYNDTDVQAFTLGGARLFDLHVAGLPSDDDETGIRARGAELRLVTPYYELRVHDNPAAVTKLETDGVATLLFSEGTTLTLLDNERASFAKGNLSGMARGDDLQVAGRSLIGTNEILLIFDQARGGFDQHRKDIGEAVAKRHVGAEASINRVGDDDIEEDVVSYGNVTMRTIKAERGNLTLEIEGHGFEGRVVVVNVDGRVLGASKREDLHVLFDNETITQATDIQDVLDPDNDGLAAEYYVVFDPETQSFQMLVSVPHYSIHTLSVMTLVQVPPPSVIAGILGGVLLLAASGVLLFRRPRG